MGRVFVVVREGKKNLSGTTRVGIQESQESSLMKLFNPIRIYPILTCVDFFHFNSDANSFL